jgi:hypothetical protein
MKKTPKSHLESLKIATLETSTHSVKEQVQSIDFLIKNRQSKHKEEQVGLKALVILLVRVKKQVDLLKKIHYQTT